jgi:hypothetical protein
MAPLTEKPMLEETILGGIATGWAYFWYAIRQFILFYPHLWAQYDRGRRKEEMMKAAAERAAAAAALNATLTGGKREWNSTDPLHGNATIVM